MSQFSHLVLVTALSTLAVAATVQAQNPVPTGAPVVDEKAFKADAPGLYANADLSYVLTSGNSSSSSLGFKGDVTRRFTRQSISFATGGIRASSSPDARTSFRGAAGITYTSEDYTVSDGQDGSFIGARVGWDFRQQLFSATTFTHSLIGDQSFEDSAARRLDAQFGLHVAMSSKLGLKVNWRILYNNQPPSTEVPLFTPGGIPMGATVPAPYKKTDQGLSVSLVFSVAPPKKG